MIFMRIDLSVLEVEPKSLLLNRQAEYNSVMHVSFIST